jgi:phosphomannomutase
LSGQKSEKNKIFIGVMQSLKEHLGEEKLKKLINFILHYIADLDIPIKRFVHIITIQQI